MASAFDPSPLIEIACQALGISAVDVDIVHVVPPLIDV
jgi:hypothetical protein